MKKTIISTCLTTALLFGCSSRSSVSTSEQPSTAESTPVTESLSFSPSATIEETVLVDESNIKITALELTYNEYEADLSIEIENNTDQALQFVSGSLGYNVNSVNGYMVDSGYVYSDITAGNKARETMNFDVEELELYGIEELYDIKIGFQIQNDDYDDYLITGAREIKTSLFDDWKQEDSFASVLETGRTGDYEITYQTDQIAFDQNNIKLLSAAMVKNSSGKPYALYEFENTGTDDLRVRIGRAAINNLTICTDNWDSASVTAGCKRVMYADLYHMLDEELWTAAGLSDIGSLSINVRILSNDEYVDLGADQTLIMNINENNTYSDPGEEVINENGFVVKYLGMIDVTEDSDPLHILLSVKNDSGQKVYTDTGYDAVALNGVMIDDITYGLNIEPGIYGLLDMCFYEDDLEEIGITDSADVTSISGEVNCETDDYDYLLDKASFSIQLNSEEEQ